MEGRRGERRSEGGREWGGERCKKERERVGRGRVRQRVGRGEVQARRRGREGRDERGKGER